jgi:tetratricopeptide (TPR) repeat protein
MLLLDVAGTRYRQGRFRDAVRAARAALRAAEDAGDDREIAHACFLLDAALTDLGDPSGAVFRERALPVYRRLGDLVGEANVHNNIGIDAYYEGRLPDALASYRRSLSCRTRAGDVIGAATAENNIGEVLSDLGCFDEALSRFEEALAVWTRAGYAVGIALASSNLARLHVRRGALDAARPLLDTAETVFRDIGSRVLLFETRVRRCELALAAGDDAVALRLVTELQAQAGSVALSPVVAAALARAHGTALLRAGEVARGRALLAEAADAFARTGLRWDHDETLRVLADVGPVALPAQREVAQVAQPTPTAVTGTAVVDLTDPVADRA